MMSYGFEIQQLKNIQKHIIGFAILLFLILSASFVQAQILFVAPNGNDKSDGTIQHPFATIERARDAIRSIKKKGLPQGGITVFIRGGNYPVSASIVLRKEDAGEEGKPIVYKAYNDEVPVFIGGSMVAAKQWKPLGAAARKRVHPKVDANKLVALDVEEAGLKNVKEFAPGNQFTTDWFIVDLFANNRRQPIAQWPNHNENIRGKNDPGWTTCNGSKDNVSFYFGAKGKPQDKDTVNEVDMDGTHRSERWKAALNSGHEIWLKGLWRTPWEPRTQKVEEINLEEQSITFCEEPPQGMGSKYSSVANEQPLWRVGSGKENWYALNLLEEIDQPGEWALDIKDKKIYYYPPAPISDLNIMISDMKAPIFKMDEGSNLQVVGLQIQGGLGNGIDLNRCNNTLIAGCRIINIGNTGISMNGGSNNVIQSNDISEIAGWGIELKNLGSRQSLSSSNVSIVNNHVHHVGELAFKEAIFIQNSVGVTIAHNLLHDIPKGSIRTDNINNCLFEYNEIHNIALKEGDTGVFYSYGGWSTYGNVFRYNFSHHTNRANAFYSDDGDSGDFYYKNIVQDCISGVKFGGGHDLVAENNLFVQSKDQTVDDRGKDRNYRLGTKYETNLTQFNLNKSPWKEYGEKLMTDHHLSTNLWSDILTESLHPELPKGCRMKDNVTVASGPFVKATGNVQISGNESIKSIAEAGFYNYATMDLRSNNKVVLQKFPELNEVFVKIGLQKDTYRKNVPSRAETGGLSNRTSAEGIDTEDKMIDKVK